MKNPVIKPNMTVKMTKKGLRYKRVAHKIALKSTTPSNNEPTSASAIPADNAGNNINKNNAEQTSSVSDQLNNLVSNTNVTKKSSFFARLFKKKNKSIKENNSANNEQSKNKKIVEEKITQELVESRRRFYKKKKKEKRRITKILEETLQKSGHEITGDEYQKKAKQFSVLIGIIASLCLSISFALFAQQLYFFLAFLLMSFVTCSLLAYMLIMIGSFIYLDYTIYQRTKEIEEVLPEFLQLASANISAGMPIDRALWFAVRPKFGILAKEIEEVAKSTIAGEDLEQALETFTKKYDSKILKESMNLLIEGMRAGGEIGFLLNQIAANMQDIKIMRKEIAASVMSYVIFITAASIIGAPFLLALSSQLLVIMTGLSSSMNIENPDSASSSSFKISMSSDSISIGDFRIFAVIVLLFTSIFSAMIISAIRKGNTNESIKIIPGYVVISLLIFFAASALFRGVMGGLFH
jgi:Flp pilus assembly protein TadB